VAVDLIPMQSLSMPPNLRSEVDDINLGLEHYYGDFNVVHVRLVSSGVSHRFLQSSSTRQLQGFLCMTRSKIIVASLIKLAMSFGQED